MGPHIDSAGIFLVQTLFSLYILALMLRFLLQWLRADFYNPLVQALVKITNPLLIPLRRVVPGLYGLDMAAVVLMLALKCLELTLVLNMLDHSISVSGLLVMACAELLDLVLMVFFWTVIIRVVMSWLNPDPGQPVTRLIVHLTEPLMRPARQLIPPFSGLDLSPIAVLILLQLTRILLIMPLLNIGRSLL